MGFFDFLKLDKPKTKLCKKCGTEKNMDALSANHMICPDCGTYMRLGAYERLEMIIDKDSFEESDKTMSGADPISFPGYDKKLEEAKKQSGLSEGVVCGVGKIEGKKCVLFVMDSNFMMGSMGSIVGEKITKAFEYATRKNLPIIGFTTSGGARMQEGIYSLMQMAKVSGAAKRHSDSGNLYITVLTDPTTGGVTASFAMQGDIIIAEPKALIGFAGQRVIEQTTGEKLPAGFQRSEFLLEHGFIDMIEERSRLRYTLGKILSLHARG